MPLLLLVLLVLLVSSALAGPGPAPAAAADDVPTLMFGAYVQPRSGEGQVLAVQRLEDRVDRPLAVIREFLLWDRPFPTSFHTGLRDTGHTLIVSVKPRRANGVRILWSDVANAPAGGALHNEIVGWAQRMRDYGGPLYFTFHHEPETTSDVAHGIDSQFIAAWRKVIGIFRDQGVTNAKFMWIMTDYSFEVPTSDRRAAFKWYPGDEWVDAIAADAYNWYNCREGINTPWRTLAQIIEGFRRFGAAHTSEEMWLAEWGSTEDPASPGRKAAWINEAAALFKQPAYEQFRGISYFHNGYSSGAFVNCRWWLDSSTSALDAFTAMGADVFYQAGGDTGPVAPQTTIESGPSGAVNSDSASFAFTSNHPDSTFECRLDGLGFEACTSPRTYTGLAEGPHVFEVRATDGTGNTDPTPAVREFTVVTSLPTIAFRAAASSGSSQARSSVTIARPAGTAPGDVMVASLVINDDDPAFRAPVGWSLLRQDTIRDVLRQAIYVKTATTVEPGSYTWRLSK
ncbi:MAG TPA: glycosyl hydrolase, partial [Acidimicrobiia bacterium]|nr:glycosyl hydrolase [Acidimicrobiia bacterium]